ncbi:hypothetical protein [Natrinema halophilum]|uniref:hypothetical protein n=1 Tax=Natrinema halophilum TaxID=1699371 RepID=UPI001F161B07|nr:hypothetical protein [Natrinema halophilum]UHQ96360.1 hypothetical protein HYG82_22175 [Natrinema halophilum]
MSDNDTDGSNEQTHGAADDQDGSDGPSFRERVEEMRQEGGEDGDGEQPQSPFGGGMGGMMGGGNPMAQMMGGMMGGGGGPPGMGGGGGPPGMGGGSGGPDGRGEEVGNEELVQEVRQLRDEMRDQTRALGRIADAIEDS